MFKLSICLLNNISNVMTAFPFDDVLKLEAEVEALPDIPPFPSIYGQAATPSTNTRRNRRRTVETPLFASLWANT